MKVLEFYRGGGNTNGHTLEEILKWSDGALEMDHDWVQFVFGSNEPSKLNGDAPTLTKEESDIFKADPELQEKVKQAFLRFLKFLHFKLESDGEKPVIKAESVDVWWLEEFNHTMLRVTRMLKSLRLKGLERYAVAFYEAVKPFRNRLSDNTWGYWTRATFDPLW